ncbi:hypothetical protein CLAFUW4_13149 [Fulvia fulva]|uniref:Uncharacterized protein n=1 Tax=Passalora fulva TaxID=5499 RepID=A0A9Q8PJU1_PASFU|nr:uncharacterized protein CLAFUR5_13007 [Fulvia fulva]KAK4611613.1 hypothetical protein CLAFUR4_13154 [Fulvia fulva]KAK4612573.1 hypothetical protein CLAFUR0_13158 [Fulvia fulva]UJO23969.1 hypothetical protein CLAFUR5_13007 [Fulvia fulva]WPV20832.1 hypothetical protein CLAFUW4_13149 [Fulvia fulva]WPV36070.1 hypothetical protein CLAFUW7_13157 [Fulvia fulva]
MADAIVEAYSGSEAVRRLRKLLAYAINRHIGQFRGAKTDYADFWAAMAAFPELEKDLGSTKANENPAPLALRQADQVKINESKADRRARKTANRLAMREAKNKAENKAKNKANNKAKTKAKNGGTDGGARASQGQALATQSTLREVDNDYESSVAGDDNDEAGLDVEDMDGISFDNVVERRTRGRTVTRYPR